MSANLFTPLMVRGVTFRNRWRANSARAVFAGFPETNALKKRKAALPRKAAGRAA
jgi:hypothetical protein